MMTATIFAMFMCHKAECWSAQHYPYPSEAACRTEMTKLNRTLKNDLHYRCMALTVPAWQDLGD